MAMVDLSQLPNELLAQIFLCLEYERATLWHLCLISRRFAHLAQPILFRHIEIRDLQSGEDHIIDRHRLQLEQSFKLRPDLLPRVLTCGAIRAPMVQRHPIGLHDPDCFREEDISFLNRFPNLQHVRLWGTDVGFNTGVPSDRSESDYRNEPTLSITLEGEYDNGTIPTYMFIPDVRDFTLVEPARYDFTSSDFPYTGQTTQIQTFTVRGGEDREGKVNAIESRDLQGMLQYCQELQVLRIQAPLGYGSINSNVYTFGSHELVEALRLVSSTLHTLDLTFNSLVVVNYFLRPIDLTQLQDLRHLKITCQCLFGMLDWSREVQDMSRYLPPSLQTLEIESSMLDQELPALFDKSNRKLGCRFKDPTISKIYDWVLDLPLMKVDDLPKLRSVKLQNKRTGGDLDQPKFAVLPNDVRRDFRQAKMKLQVLYWPNKAVKKRRRPAFWHADLM